jgi:hypothetical protein
LENTSLLSPGGNISQCRLGKKYFKRGNVIKDKRKRKGKEERGGKEKMGSKGSNKYKIGKN